MRSKACVKENAGFSAGGAYRRRNKVCYLSVSSNSSYVSGETLYVYFAHKVLQYSKNAEIA